MNKKVTRWIGIVLSFVFVVGIITGCRTETGNQDQTSTQTSAIQTTTTKISDASANSLNPDEPGWKLDTSPVTLSWYIGASWYNKTWGDSFASKYITEKTGMNLEFVIPSGDANEQVSLMMISNELPDIISLGIWETNFRKLWEGGYVQALNQLADQYDPYFYKVAGDATLKWYRQEDGNTYCIPNEAYTEAQMRETGATNANQTFLVRKDLYEDMGKPDLRTPEGFLGALQLLKDQYSTYKGVEMNPFFAQGGTGYGLTDYLQNFLAIPHQVDGKVYDRITDPEYIRWLKVFREAYSKKLLNLNFLVDSGSQIDEKTNNSRYFLQFREWTGVTAANSVIAATNPEAVYMAVDGPANSQLETAKIFPGSMSGWMPVMISKSCKNPERAIRFLSYCASEEGQRDFFIGQQGETWDIIDGNEQLLPELVTLLNTDEEKFSMEYGLVDTYWMMRNPVTVYKWRPKKPEFIQQMMDWANSNCDFEGGIYHDLNPQGDSEAAVSWTKISQDWNQVLPELIAASSEEEFVRIFDDFVKRRDSQGFDKVMAYRQQILDERNKKLSE